MRPHHSSFSRSRPSARRLPGPMLHWRGVRFGARCGACFRRSRWPAFPGGNTVESWRKGKALKGGSRESSVALELSFRPVRNTLEHPPGSVFRHFGAGGFEDAPLAVGKALNALGGNLVEDRVNFHADEVGGLEVVRRFGTLPPPKTWFGGDCFYQFAPRCLPAKAGPIKEGSRRAEHPFQIDNTSQNPAEVRSVGHMALRRGHHQNRGQTRHDREKIARENG